MDSKACSSPIAVKTAPRYSAALSTSDTAGRLGCYSLRIAGLRDYTASMAFAARTGCCELPSCLVLRVVVGLRHDGLALGTGSWFCGGRRNRGGPL